MSNSIIRIVIVQTLIFSALSTQFIAAQDDKKSSEKIEEFNLVIPDMVQLMPKPDAEGFVLSKSIDLNNDGLADLEVRTKNGRGALSTYFTTTKLIGVNGCELLKNGLPQEKGATIENNDIFKTTKSIILCNVGGSLRFPDRSYKEFSGGTWWGKTDKGLAVLIKAKEKTLLGFANVSVEELGAVHVEAQELKEIELPAINFR